MRSIKTYALKVMSRAKLSERKSRRMALLDESIIVSSQHPFITTLYNCFADERNIYLLMEYCPGGELYTLLRKMPMKRFSEAATKYYVAEVVCALEYLHMHSIIYRDLKPENILVTQYGHIRLTDFDLSKNIDEASRVPMKGSFLGVNSVGVDISIPNSKKSKCCTPKMMGEKEYSVIISDKMKDDGGNAKPMTSGAFGGVILRGNTSTICGTAEYFSPELAQGSGYSSMVDWWALGVLTYELLTGKTPFSASSRQAVVEKIKKHVKKDEDIKFPYDAKLSKQAKDFIRRLLKPVASERLGYKTGSFEIKQHPFFKGISFSYFKEPPISFNMNSMSFFSGNYRIPQNWESTMAKDILGTGASVPKTVQSLRSCAKKRCSRLGVPFHPRPLMRNLKKDVSLFSTPVGNVKSIVMLNMDSFTEEASLSMDSSIKDVDVSSSVDSRSGKSGFIDSGVIKTSKHIKSNSMSRNNCNIIDSIEIKGNIRNNNEDKNKYYEKKCANSDIVVVEEKEEEEEEEAEEEEYGDDGVINIITEFGSNSPSSNRRNDVVSSSATSITSESSDSSLDSENEG